ncbi:MAG: CGNR zinc finger domain-containing protein [Acidimicrobiales bacterium]
MLDDGRWVLADPNLAVDLLGTLRSRGDALAGDDLPDDPDAIAWVHRHVEGAGLDPSDVVTLRELLRDLFTAAVDGGAPPAGSVEALNDLAAASPVNLAARRADDDAVTVERTSPGAASTVVRAELARSALALLAAPARDRLRLCRAPGCSLFFLTDLRRQQWCSADCGNRARVARHYTRRRHPQRG